MHSTEATDDSPLRTRGPPADLLEAFAAVADELYDIARTRIR